MTRAYAEYSRPLWQRLLLTREVGDRPAGGGDRLLDRQTWRTDGRLTYLILDTTPIGLIALPMTLVFVTREIGLSVASIVGLSSVLLDVLHEAGFSIPIIAVVALLAGVACGALNGYLVAYVGLPSLAVMSSQVVPPGDG